MFATETVPRPVRRTLAEWAGRLADRLSDVRDQVRDAVIEAVGRTAAEAAEAALRHLFGVGRPPVPDPDRYAGWESSIDPWPGPPRPAPPRSWRAALSAGLHALAWWLRRGPGPALAAAAAVAGAAVLLLD